MRAAIIMLLAAIALVEPTSSFCSAVLTTRTSMPPSELHRPSAQILMERCYLSDVKPLQKKLDPALIATVVFACSALTHPTPSHASMNLSISSPSNLQQSLISLLDNLSNSGAKGMIAYTLSFILWTMTVGVTTPIETAAGKIQESINDQIQKRFNHLL